MMSQDRNVRHILSLSGGKDSAALAIFMRDRIINMEYVFCDTGKELPETYAYINKIEAYLGKPIIRLNPDYSFDHWLQVFGGFLPSPLARWCTKQLKLKPFEQHCDDDVVYSYIGIRAEEDRIGYISHKPNVRPVYPFREHGITKKDVIKILEESGLGLPEYYKWRSRSGCYFCFFQRKVEWIKLKHAHPDLFEQAKAYEKISNPNGKQFTWIERMPLSEIENREDDILKKHEDSLKNRVRKIPNRPLSQVFGTIDDEDDSYDPSCIICYL